MQNYVKIPVTIQAEQFFADTYKKSEVLSQVITEKVDDAGCSTYFVSTLEGNLIVREGSYIIRGVAGEYYSCEEKIFIKTYQNEDASPVPLKSLI